MTKRMTRPFFDFSDEEIIVDLFAGGGGASTGIEMALGRSPHVAINHDPEAIALHTANHPDTIHFINDVFELNPANVAVGRPVGLLWLSPDCKHFSKAKGGKPKSKKIRSLAWVGVKWAKRKRPRVIVLENVEEFREWGPLKCDGTVCELRKGKTFRKFVGELERIGYRVEHRELRACDYGAPTIRKRLFLVARCDGEPIVWPEPTHGDPNSEEVRSGKLLPWRTAAECIDWDLPAPSIFDTAAEIKEKYGIKAKRPLKETTMRRIAQGIKKYVINAEEPFIVTANHKGEGFRGQGVLEPVRTVTAARDATGVVIPYVQKYYVEKENGSGIDRGNIMDAPVGTITAGGGRHALVQAFMAQHNLGAIARAADAPLSTITTRGTQQQLVTSNMIKMRGTNIGSATDEPVHTITASGTHIGEVRAFLAKYYGCGEGQDLNDPLHTVTTKDHFGLVTVRGELYRIVDIGMRMLTSRELFRAQGFLEDYVIDAEVNGKPLTKTAQVRMCGNSVCPPLAAAIVGANYKVRKRVEVLA